MSKRKRTQCEVVRHVYPGMPGQGPTSRTPKAGGAGAGRVSGQRAAQAGEAAGARRAPADERLAARRAAPLADQRQLIRLGIEQQVQTPVTKMEPGAREGRPGLRQLLASCAAGAGSA